MESGQSISEPVSVELSCGIRLVQVIHPDLKGNFQFFLGAGPQGNMDMSARNNTSVALDISPLDSPGASSGVGVSGPPLAGCEVRVSVPGYQPLSKFIMMHTQEVGGINVGTLILSRIAGAQGAAISVTSLLAPKKARKEFEKGEKDARNNHLDSATKHLERAVAEYDTYAAAWNELGQIYATSQHTEEARHAFTKAMTADPQYIPPCMGLARLELQSGQYEGAVEAAGKALRLYPGLANASFIQALANYRLGRLDAAEKSARDSENGPHQNIPQLHVLLANILLRKHEYSNAAAQLQDYLKEAPEGEFAGEAKKSLEQIEKTTADVGSAPSSLGILSQPPLESQTSSSSQIRSASLRVSLRTQDDSPFLGTANVRVMPSEGHEVMGTATGPDGQTVFVGMLPGAYTVEASAPGFVEVRRQTDIEAGSSIHTVFLIMRPMPLPAGEAQLSMPVAAPAAPANLGRTIWIPTDIDTIVPNVEAGIACPLLQVVGGAGRQIRGLVEDLQKFDATEQVEHFNVDATGLHGKPETRTFDYVAVVSLSKGGAFNVDEYRNGSVNPFQFPVQIATTGLPGMALIFHPRMVSDFNLTCEGLGQWGGRPAWQVHFAQRPDRLNRIRAYVIGQNYYPVPLKGRVWVDAATYQVLRLESELMKPVQEIALTQEHMVIDYGPVQFQTHKQLWLPLDAEVYWERHGRRFYRRHTFSNFKVFEVQSAQQIQSPKQSYCFKNASDQDVAGILTVSPISGVSAKAVSIRFTVPSGNRVCKIVGPDRDVRIRAEEVGSATFVYNGTAGSIAVDANLVKETTLDLIPETNLSALHP